MDGSIIIDFSDVIMPFVFLYQSSDKAENWRLCMVNVEAKIFPLSKKRKPEVNQTQRTAVPSKSLSSGRIICSSIIPRRSKILPRTPSMVFSISAGTAHFILFIFTGSELKRYHFDSRSQMSPTIIWMPFKKRLQDITIPVTINWIWSLRQNKSKRLSSIHVKFTHAQCIMIPGST